MTSIPKNNLSERMRKLGYNPNIVTITPPVLDNSKVIKKEEPPASYRSYQSVPNPEPEFKPLPSVNIDEWSDFEEDD